MDPMGAKRRALLGVALLPLLATMPKAIAEKLSKADVQYQEQPKAGKDCDDCIQFITDPARKDRGTCKVVAGAVSAHGYCLAFTPKPKNG